MEETIYVEQRFQRHMLSHTKTNTYT